MERSAHVPRNTLRLCLRTDLTFRLVLRRQHGDGDVVRALLAPVVGHGQLEGVNTLLETADLQQARMSRLLRTKVKKYFYR